MSDFKQAYDNTMGNEGGYANNPKDRGGETYKGVSRKNWPKWAGWKVIDTVKAALVAPGPYGTTAYFAWVKHLNAILAANAGLQGNVESFYKQNFWKNLGLINDQRVAEEVFDKCVNCGEVANYWLQRAVNVPADGAIGPTTAAAVNAVDPSLLITNFNKQAKHYYEEIIKRDPSQETFRHTWMARLRNYDDSPFVA